MYKCALSAVPNQKATIRSRHDRLWCTKEMKKSQHHAEKFTSTSERPVEWIFKRFLFVSAPTFSPYFNRMHVMLSFTVSPKRYRLRVGLSHGPALIPRRFAHPLRPPLSPLAGFPEIRDCAGAVRTGGKTGLEVGDCNNEKR